MAFRNYHGHDRSSTARSAMTGGGMAVKRLGQPIGIGPQGPQGPQGPEGPKGDKGDKGDEGDPGVSPEPPVFTIYAESGDHSAAYITGSHPNWHITLVLQRGQDGICNCNCECCGPVDPPCEDPYLHAGEAGWTYDGCNWTYEDPNPPPPE